MFPSHFGSKIEKHETFKNIAIDWNRISIACVQLTANQKWVGFWMVNIPHSQQKASATPRKEGADLLTYFGHEAVGIHHQCFFFCGGGGLAKGCEKSRDLRSNLKVDPGFVSRCCFMFFLWGTFLGCNFILSQYMSHKYEIPWLCHTVGEKSG